MTGDIKDAKTFFAVKKYEQYQKNQSRIEFCRLFVYDVYTQKMNRKS